MPEEKVYPISVNAAAKKHGIPQTTLARWARQGRIRVLVHPERHGQKMLVDEASVIAAAQHHKSYWRHLKPAGQQNPGLPFRYCPYCGQPMTDGHKPTP